MPWALLCCAVLVAQAWWRLCSVLGAAHHDQSSSDAVLITSLGAPAAFQLNHRTGRADVDHQCASTLCRFLYKVIDAAFRHPHVDATVWGPGWDGYAARDSLQDNMRRRFSCNSFDVIFIKLGAFTGEQVDDGSSVFSQWVRQC